MKFYVDKGTDIFLFQLLKASGILDDYQDIRHAITQGEVFINGETALNQREVLDHGDKVNYDGKFIEVLARGEISLDRDKAPESSYEKKSTEDIIPEKKVYMEGVEHGHVKRWASKPLNVEKKIDDKIKDIVIRLHNSLIKKELTLAFAESCTGGMLQNIITNSAGCSKYFLGGITSYSDEVKVNLLSVSEQTLKKFGAVSKETAKEMVRGLDKKISANISAAITGISGPNGATLGKPIGTVFSAILINNRLYENKFNFSGTRSIINKKSTLEVLNIIYKNI